MEGTYLRCRCPACALSPSNLYIERLNNIRAHALIALTVSLNLKLDWFHLDEVVGW
jgi:hypothetical protein